MTHPKMQYTYVGIDSHKDTHTAVFIDCFFEKLGEIQFNNLPTDFDDFLQGAQAYLAGGTVFLFGLEDSTAYGRTLAVFLTSHGQRVKHVNSLLVAQERKRRTSTQKTDSIDAECAARVLLSNFNEMPSVAHDDKYWMLRTLVTRRDFLVRHNNATKNFLNNLLFQQYPNYNHYFEKIDGKTALAFFSRYPSPQALQGVTVEALTAFLQEFGGAQNYNTAKAQAILDTLQPTAANFQQIRDASVQSTIRQIHFIMDEIAQVEDSLMAFFPQFNTTLTTNN